MDVRPLVALVPLYASVSSAHTHRLFTSLRLLSPINCRVVLLLNYLLAVAVLIDRLRASCRHWLIACLLFNFPAPKCFASSIPPRPLLLNRSVSLLARRLPPVAAALDCLASPPFGLSFLHSMIA